MKCTLIHLSPQFFFSVQRDFGILLIMLPHFEKNAFCWNRNYLLHFKVLKNHYNDYSVRVIRHIFLHPSFTPERQLKFYCDVKRLEGLSFGMCCSSRYFRANCLADWVATDACAIVFQLCLGDHLTEMDHQPRSQGLSSYHRQPKLSLWITQATQYGVEL